MKPTLHRLRRRLSWLILPDSDRHRVSTALANSPVYIDSRLVETIHKYNQLLKDMENRK